MGIDQLVKMRIRTGYDAGNWRELGACHEIDTDLFFSVGISQAAQRQAAEAKSICGTCPVIQDCLAFAISTHQEYGVWGGLDEDERRSLIRKWRRRTQAS